MPLFKVWNADRSEKKFVVVQKASLELLKQKAAEKLKTTTVCSFKIVLEEDGTEIEDDEVLEEMGTTTALQLLSKNETWVPREKNIHGSVEPSGASATFSSTEVVQSERELNISSCNSGPAAETTQTNGEEVSCQSQEIKNRVFSADSSSSNVAEILAGIAKVPLPTFSGEVMHHLECNTVELVWSKMISQVAEYYFEKWPGIGERSQYALIGEKMYKRWPCIRQEVGAKPWSMFSKSLSQRIRHKRLSIKQKSQLVSAAHGEPSAKRRKVFTVTSAVANEADTSSHMEALCTEWRKPRKNQNVAHIKMLLRATQIHRETLLLEDQNRSLKSTFQKYPCFKDGLYILFAFTVKYGAERLGEISKNMKRFMMSVENLGKLNCENSDLRFGEIIKFIEEKVKFDRGQKTAKAFSSLVEVKEDVPDDEIKQSLKSYDLDPPRLIVFVNDQITKAMFILADGNDIRVHGSSLHSGITQLLAAYYVFNLNYPRCFSMVLAVLQTFVMGESYTKHRSKNQVEVSKKYTFFVKQLRATFDSTLIEEEETDKD